MKRSVFITVLLTIVSSHTFSQDKAKRIDTIMSAWHRYNMFDGAVLVAENGKVLYEKGFGLANREWSIPNTPTTKFMIGSISKPLTSILTLIQVQKGLIDPEKTIADYLPDFSATAKRIKIKYLMSHTSGIPNYDIIPDFFPRISRTNYTREEYIKIYKDSALLFEPGSNYYYSSWGYFTLGYILEKVTGKSYSQLMKEDIFDKIGMKNSGSYYHTQIVADRATGYDYSLGGYTSSDFRDQSNTMGAGDIYSTVEDLFKLHLALTNNTLLNKQLTEQMFTPGIRPWRYGYGWFNQKYRYTPTDSIFANYHLGMTEGFISFLVRIPETNSLVVLLCNSSPTDFFGIASSLIKVLYNKPVALKQPINKVMETLIATKGTREAVNKYDELKKDSTHYYADWWAVDQLGHQLYTLKRYNEALLIFEKNALEFPQRDIALISLADTYDMLGKKDEAIIYYKKAIEINSNNEEAKNKLKTLQNK